MPTPNHPEYPAAHACNAAAVGAVLQMLAPAAQPAAVQIVLLKTASHPVADHDGDHERRHDRVVARHLEDEQDGGDRRPGGRGDHGTHPHERVRFRRDGEGEPQRGTQRAERDAHGPAGGGADEERRRE